MKSLKTTYPVLAYADSRQGGRVENQDTCAWGDTPAGFLVTVCDGMGGGPSGKMASMLAADTILQYVIAQAPVIKDRKELVTKAIQAGHERILQAVAENPASKGMGTTATVLLINQYSAIVAHVGDSRVYQFRRGHKHFRTDDHSLVFEKIREGEIPNEEEARLSPDSNIILRALGINAVLTPDVVELAYEQGDRFMLCSDGIWGAFPEKTIISMAASTPVLSGAVESMVVKVDEAGKESGGGHDNLTIALVETKCNSKMHEKMSTKQRNLMIILAAVCLVSLVCNGLLLSKYIPEHRKAKEASLVTEHLVDSLVQRSMEEQQKKYQQLVESLNKSKDVPEQLEQTIAAANENVHVLQQLDDIIRDCEKLALMKAGEEKNALLEQVQKRFDEFADKNKAKLNAATVAKVKELLGQSIAKADNDDPKYKKNQGASGHYTGNGGIVPLLKQLKNNL